MTPQLQFMFSQAVQAFQAGHFAQAEQILNSLMRSTPGHFDITHLLAIVCASQDQHEKALTFYQKALQINPKHAQALSNQSASFNALGRNLEALEAIKKALAIDSQALQYWYNGGNILCDLGQSEQALAYYEKAIALNPQSYQAYNNYGKALFDLERYEQALVAYDQALIIDPQFIDCLINKGATLNKLKHYESALAIYDQVLTLKPDYAEAWCLQGNLLRDLKRFSEALVKYDQAIMLKPDYAEAWCNKGAALNSLKRHQEALDHYARAVILEPTAAEVYFNQAISLAELNRFEEALAQYDHAIRLKPAYPEALCNKGAILNSLNLSQDALFHFDLAIKYAPEDAKLLSNKGLALSDLMLFDQALAQYEKSLRIDPEADWVFGDYFNLKQKVADWVDFELGLQKIITQLKAKKKIINPFFFLPLIDDPVLHKLCSEIFSKALDSPHHQLDRVSTPYQNKKIRIAYFSGDFRDHPIGALTSELFELHDRSQFEIFAFSTHRASDKDLFRSRLKNAFDQFIDVESKTSIEIAQLARDLKIDIAVDLAGHTRFAPTGAMSYRAAPIQINYLGYPGTMGAEYMDYIIADHTLIPPESQQFYTEKVIYLPDTYIVDDSKRVASSRIFTRAECGLPQNQIIFCCFNNSYKFNPTMLKSWASILMQVPNSVFWVSQNNPFFRENLLKEFEVLGIASERIIFANKLESMADHLARLSLADLFLDTAPYNAHTTALDSLKAGVPIITYLGQAFAGRVGASVLNAIELPELITHSLEGYEQLAVALAQDPERLQQLKTRLAHNKNTTALFDTPRFVRNLEDAYRRVYEEASSD